MRCYLISTVIVVAASSTAFADKKISPPALAELERGEQHFRDKEYAAAIESFDKGYAIDPQPIFLYDKAQALRLSGDCAGAIESYDDFLAADPPANEAARAKKNLENCKAMVAKVAAAKPATLAKPAPPAKPAAVADDDDEAVSSDDEEATTLARTKEPAPAAKPLAVTATETQSWWHDHLGVGLMTTGVIALGISAGFAVAAKNAADQTALATNQSEWSVARLAWQQDRLASGVALGAGAALLTFAVIRFSTHDRTVRVAATSGSGAVVAVGGHW